MNTTMIAAQFSLDISPLQAHAEWLGERFRRSLVSAWRMKATHSSASFRAPLTSSCSYMKAPHAGQVISSSGFGSSTILICLSPRSRHLRACTRRRLRDW